MLKRGLSVPLIGDFHYIGHTLLTENPACAEALDKYRINPGNVGFGEKRDRQFATLIELALRYDKPVRIGVNWGSLDQALLTRLMDDNAARRVADVGEGSDARGDRAVGAALGGRGRGDRPAADEDHPLREGEPGPGSGCRLYRLAARTDHALHLGLTEAGMGSKGIVASSAALGILLQQGIGDTIRISLTPEPNGDRTREVKVAQELLQTMGFRAFVPVVAACPGCGRTTSTVFLELAKRIEADLAAAMPVWREKYPGRRGAVGRGHGLHRQRPRRIQARRHRHLAARHRRAAGGAGVHRRQEGGDAARPDASPTISASWSPTTSTSASAPARPPTPRSSAARVGGQRLRFKGLQRIVQKWSEPCH